MTSLNVYTFNVRGTAVHSVSGRMVDLALLLVPWQSLVTYISYTGIIIYINHLGTIMFGLVNFKEGVNTIDSALISYL